MTKFTTPASPKRAVARQQIVAQRDAVASIVTAYSFAVSLPLIDLLRDNAAFFVIRSSPPADFYLFFLGLVLLIPAALVALVFLSPKAWRANVHAVVFGGLVAVLSLRSIKHVALLDHATPVLPSAVAVALGVVGLIAFRRWETLRQLLRYAAFVPLVLAGLFFASASVRAAMASSDSPVTTAVSGKQSIVFVVFDELPAVSLMDADGNLNGDRYPNFARLAEASTWFRNASTSSSSTIDSVPSLLTGRYPAAANSSVPTLSVHPQNLFTMFAASHEITATEPITRLCPEGKCRGKTRDRALSRLRTLVSDVGIVTVHTLLPSSFTRGLPPVDEKWGYFGSNRDDFQESITPKLRNDRVLAFEQFIENISVGQTPSVYFIHSLLPHRPWTHVPSGDPYLQIERIPGISSGVWDDDKEWLIDQGLQRHLLQVGTADTLVGQLLDRLVELQLLDDSILVVTSDHGTAFHPGEQHRSMADATLGAMLPVPLFITIPGHEGQVVDDPVELVDLLPTLAELTGAIVRDWSFDGRTLIETRESRDQTIVYEDGVRSLSDLAYRRDRELELLNQRVPMSGGWDELFDAGPGKHLLGVDVLDLVIGRSPGWTSHIDAFDYHFNSEVDGEIWPLMVTGYLEGNPRGVPVDLAVAINGRVSAVTKTFDQARGSMFSALTRLQDMREGRRELSIFVVEGLGSDDVLLPLDIVPADE